MFDAELSPGWMSQLDQEQLTDVVDFRFTDLPGRWGHVVHWAEVLRDKCEPPLVSIASTSLMGWGAVQNSELALRPHLETAFVDPFASERSTVLTCGIVDPRSGRPDAKDPRATLERAVEYLKASGIADTMLVGVELEFHVFEGIRFRQSAGESSVAVDEGDPQSHRIAYAQHHYATAPSDWASSFRSGLLKTLRDVGVVPLHHQHEAGLGQHEISLRHGEAISAADAIQKAKYVVLNSVTRLGKTATFMPKPMAYRPGSGLHLNVSLWREGVPLFAGEQAAGLSEVGIWFLAGVLAHTRALNALLNPSTNGYKRIDGLFNPMLAAFYGTANRSAPIRVPFAGSPSEKRLEIRYADATANPYLALAAVLMAGLDGIERKLSPGVPYEADATRTMGSFDPRKRSPLSLCRTVEEAVVALDGDRTFLTRGEVFSEALVDAQLAELCRQARVSRGLPHPNEFPMFYGC
ncbi:MAG: glutamine synthetase beta-grasp domain-containing protein [Reyranella sp.]|nr:glutamine synthetase beta-grasp domain-containing protein [Reyranella sp.]